VELEDRITVAAPEGVELQLTLAGAGSRCIAGCLDLTVKLVLIALTALAAVLIGGGIAQVAFFVAVFTILYLYDVLFEVLAAGQTPGKRVSHLRVVRDGGQPVDLPSSAVRNLLRVIDILPGVYLVGLVSIVLTRRNQRLGDLAAGTLVTRERPKRTGMTGAAENVGDTNAQVAWDVSAVTASELAAVRRFLERRETFDTGARRQLACRLEQGLRSRVAGAGTDGDPERFLEALARAKSSR
jgi:uncharacterized RDD family membrane protein YckC